MSPAERRSVKVRILDREYAFASQGEETDARLQEVAHLVDEKMREVRRTSRTLTPMQIAILAGLELVDELLRSQRDASAVEADISQRASRLTESLGELLRGVEVTPLSVQPADPETGPGAAD